MKVRMEDHVEVIAIARAHEKDSARLAETLSIYIERCYANKFLVGTKSKCEHGWLPVMGPPGQEPIRRLKWCRVRQRRPKLEPFSPEAGETRGVLNPLDAQCG